MKTLEQLSHDQEVLTFKEFSNEMALELGVIMANKAAAKGYKMAFSIIINQREVFKYGATGTTNMSDVWMQRKANTVYKTTMSSLKARAFFAGRNSTFFDNWFVSREDHADVGGGFPITLENGLQIGVIVVTGLAHEDDHEFIVETLHDYLGK
ncbi:heme-binding protein [Bengtsoniella intestinalis]|uniref:heme-binding protein n=1 Tax=Bengtsoniella intestinalis TaxID=3073143 RepID=UPI00391EE464